MASGEILSFVFGSSYSAGWDVLLILVFGQTLSVLVGSPGVLMAMSDRQTTLMIIGTSSGLVGIVVSLSLVGEQGILGVAIGAVTGKVQQNIVMWVYCLKVLEIKTHATPLALANIRNVLKKN